MMNLMEKDKSFVANTYNRFPVEIVKGSGSFCYDKDGKEYIDLGSGIGVNAFGYCDKEWKEAVLNQLNLISHTSNLYYTQPQAELAKLLCEKTGMKKVFFGNSGAEANECAIKLARKYGAEHKGEEYSVIVTLKNSFHGRTLSTLSATGQDSFHRLFNPLTPNFVHTTANDLEEFKRITEENKVCGVLIECVQGEGGVNCLDKDFVEGVFGLCQEKDILFMVDEVQTGNGRTGKLYAYMNYNVTPDVVTTAKGLGGGLPIGAVLIGEKAEFVLGFGDHGSTFGGNPICCAGAISVINRLTDEFLEEVLKKSEYIFKEFSSCDKVETVSGMGLMIGIKPLKEAKEVVSECIKKGVLCLTAKDKIRLLPPLNIDFEALKKAVAIIKECL